MEVSPTFSTSSNESPTTVHELPNILIPLPTAALVDSCHFEDKSSTAPTTPLTKVSLDTPSGTMTPPSTRPSSQFTNNEFISPHLHSGSKHLGPVPSPPGVVVSQLFYESVSDTQPPPASCQIFSGTGAAAVKGETSADSQHIEEEDEETSSLHNFAAHMPPRGGDSSSRGHPHHHHHYNELTEQPPPPSNTIRRPVHRQSISAPHQLQQLQQQQQQQQHSFNTHSFTHSPFYASRSVPPPDQYVHAGAYPGAAASFMGQYMSTQPPHSIAIQSPVAFFSTSYTHPGIHAHDPSGMGMHFPPVPMSQGFAYATGAGPTPTSTGIDAAAAENDPRSPQGYNNVPNPPSSFVLQAGGGSHHQQQQQQVPPPPSSSSSNQPASPHHAYVPPPAAAMHYTPPPHSHPSHPPNAAHYAYPSHSYAQPTPGVFAYASAQYPAQSFYAQPSPVSPEEANNTTGGTWWYLPPSGSRQPFDSPSFHGLYHAHHHHAHHAHHHVQGYQQPQPSVSMGREYDQMYHHQHGSSPGAAAAAGDPGLPSQLKQHTYPLPLSQHLLQQQQQQRLQQRQPSTFPPPSPVLPEPVRYPDASPSGPTPNPPGSSSHSAPSSGQAKRRGGIPDGASGSPSHKGHYPPNLQSNRSEWVMWVGNVPADAMHDELYRFFNQPQPQSFPPPSTSAILSSRLVQPQSPSSPIFDERWGGVSSVFLIARSNCAFINFDSQMHLTSAVAHFNGKPLRPKDPRCPRLVCRVRGKEDDLRAGVHGQRKVGLHTRWVEEQKARQREKAKYIAAAKENRKLEEEETAEEAAEGGRGREEDVEGPPTSPSSYLAPSTSSADPSPPIPVGKSPIEVTHRPQPHFSSSVSPRSSLENAPSKKPSHSSSGDRSTNSSFLSQNFPKRYFILKSLTQFDLNLSVEKGVWATQLHNEAILDQAYRTSKDVFLIFGANKSGEFFGYARMAGPISHGERVEQAPWASRSSRRESSPIAEEDPPRPTFLTPSSERPLNESPAAVSPEEDVQISPLPAALQVMSAPIATKIHDPLTRPTLPVTAVTRPSALHGKTTSGIVPTVRNLHRYPRADQVGGAASKRAENVEEEDEEEGEEEEVAVGPSSAPLQSSSPSQSQSQQQPKSPTDKPEGWGREFKIQWVRTERLPFHRTRHLRNPWNQDREIKVSRDGTELEPSVGQRLLEEWDRPEPPGAASTPAAAASSSTSPVKSVRSRAPARGGGGGGGSSTQMMPTFTSQIAKTGGGAFGRGKGGPQTDG